MKILKIKRLEFYRFFWNLVKSIFAFLSQNTLILQDFTWRAMPEELSAQEHIDEVKKRIGGKKPVKINILPVSHSKGKKIDNL